ncbi:5586_t:CDS:2 [Funneliformis geosporum]|uniref:RNA-dependent RNA polymerase n=1 Tax=Funneliformis geosporum TaxID=1117311 RepID=A0A9W4SSR2_9GLOM|nr:9345_t:CDS:2 [Funneliformis geosporum]CAI2180162.1 5586_t:CDS:2 [Funneliformis geosporum]
METLEIIVDTKEKRQIKIKSISYKATEIDVIKTLSKFGPIANCKIIKHKKKNRHSGFGYVEFENEKDADKCISESRYNPPKCMGRELYILRVKRKKENPKWNDLKEATITFSNLEIGNWDGQSSKVHKNSKGRGRRSYTDTLTEKFTFLKEWEYPNEYEKPSICFSKTADAFVLEGFNSSLTSKRRVKIPFRILTENARGIFMDDSENGVISLYISLKHPPYLYREQNFMPLFHFLDMVNDDPWIRTVDWTGTDNIFGRCLVFRLVFRYKLNDLCDLLDNFKLKGIQRPMPRCPVNCIKNPDHSKEYFEIIIQTLPFGICYKLESLISHGTLTHYELEVSKLGESLAELVHVEEQEVIAWHALNQISAKYWDPFDRKSQDRPISNFNIALKSFKSEFNVWYPSNPNIKLKNDSRNAWVNHATITPTKIYFDGPNYEQSNRILRLYEDKIDRFLRVTFKEENFDKLFVNKEDVDIINLRIINIMKNGFHVAGRYYEFLAFSSSQLKEASCWFVAPFEDFNANAIRTSMGEFRDIKVPALYASRMGQCFTSTMGTLKLNPDQVHEIMDIKRNNYTFSDGCGKISLSLAKRAAKEYYGTKNLKDDEIPSVFQIRFGGCKGMVAVDPNLEGDVLCIRPSQKKFDAPDSSILEIAKTVKTPLPGHSNRQIIMILSTLGVPDEVFSELQNEMCADIDSMMTNENKAREIVKRNTGIRECLHITRTILSMIEEGMMQGIIDPFLNALLECKRVYALKVLRHKARILMPKSFLLLGVIDETGKLEENEVYLQTSTIVSEHLTFNKANNKIRRESKVWTGPAVITRNPCLHPGDLRKVEAVDIPELSHLRNCVVFSQKGDRPLPNCLEPMEFDSQGKKELDRDVEIVDICEFFKDYMLNNRLGQIANLHLALADYNEMGIRSAECIKLAQLHSNAVDFNKTGIPVVEKLAMRSEYPDFMDSRYKDSYKSEKVLGKLYRDIQLDKPEKDPLLKYYKTNITIDENFLYEGYQDYIEEAIACLDHYNNEIRSLMKKYNVKTEAEILTAQLLGFRRIDGSKSQDMRDAITGSIFFIIYNCRKQFLMDLQDSHNDHEADEDESPFNLNATIPINNESKAKASAWYYVTYNQDEYPEEEKNKTTLLSFPWVVSDILLAIRRDNMNELQSYELLN